MAELNEIKSAIKEIAQSVNGIGVVYERLIYAKDHNQLKELFVKEGVLNCLMFRQVKRTADPDSRTGNEVLVDRTWKFVLLYAYNYENKSEEILDDICEQLCKRFNANCDLNGKVNEHSYFDMTNKTDYSYHNVLCHRAEFEMITRG
jgi:hypothetical protein